VAAAVAAIVFGATTLQGPSSSSVQPAQKSGVSQLSATRIANGSDARYPAATYFVGRRATKVTQKEIVDQPVIVRTADLTVVATLPITLMGAHLSSDGSRMFGYYAGSAGHAGTDNSDSTNPAVKRLVNRDRSFHAVYYDFSTGDVVQLGVAAWPGITGMTATPDGQTIAYARTVTSKGRESTVIRVLNVATAKWHEFTVPRHRQTLALALSPDATKLAFTETDSGNILFMADLADANPAASATAVVPPQPCRNGAYDYPIWADAGLYAARECEPDSRGLVSDVVRLDPTTLVPAGASVVPLPDGGVLHLNLLATPSGPEFAYVPARSATPDEHGDMRIVYMNNLEWLVKPGESTGHRTSLLWTH